MTRILSQRRKIYELMCDRITAADEARGESLLTWISMLVSFCWFNPPGYYADARPENILFEMGEDLDRLAPAHSSDNIPALVHSDRTTQRRRKIMHVASQVYLVGGHSRVIGSWIELDTNSIHSLFVINQEDHTFPAWLSRAVSDSGGTVMTPNPDLDSLAKAQCLRQAAKENADLVILHHHPNDPIPALALASESCPPVAIFNHADHVFWLGSSIADLVIDFRSNSQAESKRARFAIESLLLPLPIRIDSVGTLPRKLLKETWVFLPMRLC